MLQNLLNYYFSPPWNSKHYYYKQYHFLCNIIYIITQMSGIQQAKKIPNSIFPERKCSISRKKHRFQYLNNNQNSCPFRVASCSCFVLFAIFVSSGLFPIVCKTSHASQPPKASKQPSPRPPGTLSCHPPPTEADRVSDGDVGDFIGARDGTVDEADDYRLDSPVGTGHMCDRGRGARAMRDWSEDLHSPQL